MEQDAASQQNENSEASQSPVEGPDSDDESYMEQDTAPTPSEGTGASQGSQNDTAKPQR